MTSTFLNGQLGCQIVAIVGTTYFGEDNLLEFAVQLRQVRNECLIGPWPG